jgi:excisionase family DNA binding protein
MAETTGRNHMATIAPQPRLLRVKEVANILGVSPHRVRELVANGDLASIRLGSQGWHRFRFDDVERLIAGDAP